MARRQGLKQTRSNHFTIATLVSQTGVPASTIHYFLEGKVDYSRTAWGIPSYSVFGWQRPCYLMADGYTATYKELIETTDWERYGRHRDPRCANCMAHCGYEPTAVLATTHSFRESLRAAIGTH